MSSLTIIVATDIKNGIGIQNKLPWHLPEDLAHFKRTTSGHAILMGRKTFESIGRPLPNRRNIVISRDPEWQHTGVETANSLAAAQALLGDENAYIIGGAQIYQQALALADRLIVTEIDREFACDAFFPEIKQQDWEEVAREKHFSEANQLNYAFVTYKKRDRK
ncbi:dihydrofolate reductase [Undibacterium piscinae]|uniref:Dihydrofolate reductase n=1 Tax=Undibacterium piscinae TaxID=2495591 RepID=A0A6M4A372_9BURK|nr:dihydrofolate reductase [Undibacterium piscinae]